MNNIFLPLSLLLLTTLLSDPVGTQEERCICVEELPGARSLVSPHFLTNPKDGTGRLFYGEKFGVVWIIFEQNGTRLEQPFLNITNITHSPGEGELGLSSIAFHPQFTANKKLYMVYTILSPEADVLTLLSEFLVSATNPNAVDLRSERRILTVLVTAGYHTGGRILFGNDGYLYLLLGDGGPSGDPYDNAQDLSNLSGKCLRINVDVGTGDGQFGIPPDNPFVGVLGAREEIYTYGFRHPWGFEMDPGDPETGAGRGRIFIGDIGQDAWEEVDIMTAADAGGNYGWSVYEASECYKPALCDTLNPDDLIFPIHAYNHSIGNCVIGGNVYRGSRSPGLNSLYFFADWGYGKLFYLEEDGSGGWTRHQFSNCNDNNCTTTCDRCSGGMSNFYNTRYINHFATGDNNDMYIATTNSQVATDPGGAIYRLVEAT